MGAFPIAEEVVLKLRKQLGISTLAQASIRQIVQLADGLQDYCGEGFIRTEMGVPGLPAAEPGVDAQVAALHEGVASVYPPIQGRSEEHTSELQSRPHLVCRLLLEKKKKKKNTQ